MSRLVYTFYNDYSEGAHPKILEALTQTNTQQEAGYGDDTFCFAAAELIKEKIQQPHAAVHFVSGGTQANLIVLSSLLKPYEAVIAARTGHIYVHEAGAIEATGHKVIAVESKDGKLRPEQILEAIKSHTDEHMVKPRVVYISNSTELGTIYTKKELQEISKICRENGLYLSIDGARLGCALSLKSSDLSLPDIASIADVFSIGGTKNGALLGEAIVIINPSLQENFRYHLKQRGALLAKGRVLGIQFMELFTNNLFFDLAKHANEMAEALTDGIAGLGYEFFTNSPTNQIFPIFTYELIKKLEQKYGFYIWSEAGEGQAAIRLVTSWATPRSAIDEFLSTLKSNSSDNT